AVLLAGCPAKHKPGASSATPQTAPQAAAPAATPAASSSGGNNTEWPRFQGPYGNSLAAAQEFNTDWNSQPPQKLWEVAMGDNGFAGPSSAGGKVYIIDHQGQEDVVRCLDLSSGSEVWTYRYNEGGGDNYGFSRATPCVDGGKVYTISRSGLVNCLDAAGGQKVWSKSLASDLGGSAPQWLYAPSPVVDGNAVIVIPGGGKGAVAALDKASGTVIWQGGGSDKCSYATPVPAKIGGVKQYVIFGSKALFGVRADNGKQLWRVGWETGCDVNAATPLVDGNRIFITSGYNHGCAAVQVSGNGAKIVWQNKTIQAHFSSSVLYEGKLYGIGDPGNLVCLDPANGKTLWQKSGFEKGGLIVVYGNLMAFQGGDGALVLVKAAPTAYTEVSRFTPLGGQSWTAPIVAGGKLIVRNKEKLAAFTL
ncbi:MAG: PQQ-like beta-propeller repeat protein, partial [Armatimonadetes bacterium]|nr:PQQ-like beta-propeller repeat protein [Armatimonadota bacterium]